MADQADLRAALQAILLAASKDDGWLSRQRWYADKGRSVISSEVMALRLEPTPEGVLALSIVQFRFADHGASRYFLPLYLTAAGGDNGGPLGRVGEDAVFDAVPQPWFGDWLLAALHTEVPGWPAAQGPLGANYLERAARTRAHLLRGEQSNSSLRYGDAIIVKVFRKLQPGINPDEEALSVLSTQGFTHAPAFVGSIAWLGPDAIPFPVALASSFVPHQSDGWTWLLARLAEVAAGKEVDVTAERLLGQRTAEMHLALAAAADEEFVPLRVSEEDIRVNATRTKQAIQETREIINERAAHLPSSVQGAMPEIEAALHEAGADLAGYDAELGTRRIRTHGDYHLGQTLRTDSDWVILDFEGEPARPVAERRQRASVLKDVSGMLRSFAYARGAAALSLAPEERAEVAARLQHWESAARAAFLEAYRQKLASAGADLVPASEGEFARALRAWELDKALYEVAYEARNRPTWLEIPLAALTGS